MHNHSAHEPHGDSHDHMHHHHHGHHHDITNISKSRLFLVVVLNILITVAELVGGLFSGSNALVADAIHNLNDAASLVISYFSIKVASRQPDAKRPFGYKRATILSACLNSIILVILSLFVLIESIQTFFHPKTIEGNMVMYVAGIGVLANFVGMLLLSHGAKQSLTIKSNYIHLLSDTLSSLFVLLGAFLIQHYHLYWLDMMVTILITAMIIQSVYPIIQESLDILMEGTPESVDVEGLKAEILQIEGIEEIQSLRIWKMDEHENRMEIQIRITDMLLSGAEDIKKQLLHIIQEHYGVKEVVVEFGI
ncbi:cation diffusion facilitator family transporter (plasmid) [Aneurinibacillus sp. Ricciae_BoGa-3]|uniref:cation diffusion facilitator family transporter n=1 Tax=Aneurinibacillus sp. Ricciae_BoGa-3 TaxID=3022697 RepID=UPI0023400C22|nr:cation diffusion facilitator family transporter [Aneurinibacillus sp. Ricciae_BoGa-3]WCK57046.1 cation diffusion facilitator family transporter [Aneurinibacillus sp. Ricciae_BoGa-3]